MRKPIPGRVERRRNNCECRNGPYAWRDCQKPLEILESVCKRHQWQQPEFAGSGRDLTVRVAGRIYRLADYSRSIHPAALHGAQEERLALFVLLDREFPIPLVSQHVETRRLFSPLHPGIEQVHLPFLYYAQYTFLHYAVFIPSKQFT